MNVTFLTKYSSKGASSRYRYFLYLNTFIQNDINLEIDGFLDTSYVDSLYKGNISVIKIVVAYIKRFFVIMNSAKFLVIEYEVFPYAPYFIEGFFLRNKQYVLNFDDNVWDKYKDNILLKKKFDQLSSGASGVIVANNFLYSKVVKLNKNIIKIPTVVDTELYKNTEKFEKFEKFSLVWVGTSTTYKYILSHANIFIELASLIDYQIIVVASKELSNKFIKGVNMKFYDWSSCNEIELIKKSHIGIMPLDNDNFSQGKSALKLIQYMSSGLPVVASSVGENNIVVSDGKNGFLVKNNTDWVDSIQSLHKDIVLYKNFSEKSLSISGDYSIANYGGKYCNFLKDSFTCL